MRKLFTPDPAAIGRPPGPAQHDAVDAAFAHGTPRRLREELSALLGAPQVLHRVSDLVRYASDASPYRLLPQVVALPRDTAEVAAVLGYCRRTGRHATFRAAGTSMNGQAQSDDVLIDVRRGFQGVTVEDGGTRLRARPGTVLQHANAALRRHGRRLGPDPASAAAATVGGVIANNAAGMRCTLERDSYHTVVSLTFVLASGTVVDTAAPDAEEHFARAEPELAAGLLRLRAELLADEELARRVRRKSSIRNTTGYALAALLDADTPVQIFRRLLVGSEGTLAFIAEAVFETLPAPAATTLAWIPLPSIDAAAALVPDLVALGAEAVELMVAPALTVAAHAMPGTPQYWKTLPQDAAALLVEFGADDSATLDLAERSVAELIARTELLQPLEFTRDAETIDLYWRVREGMLGLIGTLRPEGVAVVTEDVCFPPERVAEGARDLMALLTRHGFLSGVAGHAAYGNLHFILTPKFADPADRDRYAAFMADLVALVVDEYDGSLKAEHGTGLNMAPFVAREWGEKAVALMWRVKELADPHGVLGPNVLLTRDTQLHLKNLKSAPPVEAAVTQCIECGLCESVCPSRNLGATPRQRIALRREMARQPAGSALLARLQEEYRYDGVETCAVDGTCAVACPMSIDTGTFIKELRRAEATRAREWVALRLAQRWATVERLVRGVLGTADVVQRAVGPKALGALSAAARSVLSQDLVPAVPGALPHPAGNRLPATEREGAAGVYFPACINRMFGRDPGHAARPTLPEALVVLSARAGRPLWIPPDVRGLCCSTPWASKGYTRGHAWMATAVGEALWRWSGQGTLPVIVDAASCTHGLLGDVKHHVDADLRARLDQVEIVDATAWCRDLLPALTVSHRLERVAVHPTCSTTHLGVSGALKEIAGRLADEALIPIGTTCCGTAGDRGLLHPELVVSATREEKAGLDATPAQAYLSANRTCEMGLRQATGQPYESFVFLLEELTRAGSG
jgi:D-lactate dehydrogenase